jgi:protoporphyrinogen oxidase
VEGEIISFPCSQVYSTIPLPELVAKLDPSPPPAVLQARAALRFRALRFVNVMLRRELVSPNTWMYVADRRYRISRIQEPKHRSPDMAPPGCTSLMLEVPCNVGDALWRADDEEILPELLRELEDLGFSLAGDVVGSFSARVAHGYPIYHLGYASSRDVLLSHLGRYKNVISGGRQGLFRYIFLDAAMQMGKLAGHQIMHGVTGAASLDAIRREKRLIEADALTA